MSDPTIHVAEAPFQPNPTSTVLLAATTAAQTVNLVNPKDTVRIRVASGTSDVYFKFGQGAAVTAQIPASGTPGDIGMFPGTVEVFAPPFGTDRISVIAASGTVNVWITTGSGV